MTHETLSPTPPTASTDGYEPPRLDELGTLADLTQGGAGDESDGGFLMTSIGPT